MDDESNKNLFFIKDFKKTDQHFDDVENPLEMIERLSSMTGIQETMWRISDSFGPECPICEMSLCRSSSRLPECHIPIFSPLSFPLMGDMTNADLRKSHRTLLKTERLLIKQKALSHQRQTTVFLMVLVAVFVASLIFISSIVGA